MSLEFFVADPHGQYDQLAHNLQEARALVGAREDKLHFVGDVYDRGPQPDKIMEELMAHPNIDIQWGNHDIVWMGASLGQRGCICNVVRICAHHNNLNILEQAYGMDLSLLRSFVKSVYDQDDCARFVPKNSANLDATTRLEVARIQKAVAILQFKVEAQTIADNPRFNLERRNLLHRIDYQARTVEIEGGTYKMLDTFFPTVDPANPYALTDQEEAVMEALEQAFTSCEPLQRHMALFLKRGNMYTISGNTLMLHACVPLTAEGTLMPTEFLGQTLSGRALFDAVETQVRAAYTTNDTAARKQGLDTIWYLWLGVESPLFTKSKMATFELYFCSDKEICTEKKDAFYALLENPNAFDSIFRDFGLDPATAHLVIGHTPVKAEEGEDPVKCGGKVIMIDGHMPKAHEVVDGIAGYTLIFNDGAFTLLAHKRVESGAAASARTL